MSTHEALWRLVEARKVVHVPPVIPGAAQVRHFFLEADLNDRLQAASQGFSEEDVRLARLYADIDRFTSGQIITLGNDPFDKDNSAYMARTWPPQDGIFDLRSQDPKPALRVFGAFCETDMFVGLTWRYRKELRGRDERLFEQAILSAMGVWNQLFPEHRPFYSENPEEHITNVQVV